MLDHRLRDVGSLVNHVRCECKRLLWVLLPDKFGDNVGNKNIQNKTMKNNHHYYDKEWTKKWNISLKRDHVIRIQTRKGTGIHCSDYRGRNGGRRTWALQILINYIWWPFKSVMNYNLLYFSSYINNNLWILYTK